MLHHFDEISILHLPSIVIIRFFKNRILVKIFVEKAKYRGYDVIKLG